MLRQVRWGQLEFGLACYGRTGTVYYVQLGSVALWQERWTTLSFAELGSVAIWQEKGGKQ